MRDGYLRGALARSATPRQLDVLAAYVAAGGSVPDAAARVGILAKPGQTSPRRHACAVWSYHRSADLCRNSRRVARRSELGASVNER